MRLEDLDRDGLRLAVHSAGDGPEVVLQHGLCGDAGQTADAAPEGFRSVTLEGRGHGASPAGDPGALSLATFADDLAALIESRPASPLAVGGISMGAALALRLAVLRPGLVRALVLARPAWACDSAPDNLVPYAEVGDLLARLPPDEARAAFDASPSAARLAAEALDNLASLRGFFGREPIAVTQALLQRIPRDGPGVTEADLAALRLPTLVIGHGVDLAHPWATAERLAALIPGAQLVRVPPKATDRAAHMTAMRAAIADFLHEVAA